MVGREKFRCSGNDGRNCRVLLDYFINKITDILTLPASGMMEAFV